jgi:hypothetical protein
VKQITKKAYLPTPDLSDGINNRHLACGNFWEGIDGKWN